jgi:threonine/homoserine/homoserine lactone efflux protein
LLLALSPRAAGAGSAFAAGWATGVIAATAAFALLGGFIELADYRAAWVSWLLLAAGVALVALGVRQWLARGGAAGDSANPPSWMAPFSSASPGRAYVLGLGLSGANPKILLLAAAAGLTIADAEAGLAHSIGSVLLVGAVGSIAVGLPVLAGAVGGERVVRPLELARDWLVRHNDSVTAVVIVAIGVAVTLKGAAGL